MGETGLTVILMKGRHCKHLQQLGQGIALGRGSSLGMQGWAGGAWAGFQSPLCLVQNSLHNHAQWPSSDVPLNHADVITQMVAAGILLSLLLFSLFLSLLST